MISSNIDSETHVQPTGKIPDTRLSNKKINNKISNIISYCLIDQIKNRIKGLEILRPLKTEISLFFNTFKYQHFLDREHAIVYIYYVLPRDLEGLLDRGSNIRERINNKIVDQILFETGYNARILSGKRYKDYRNDKHLGTNREYLPYYTIGLWKNEVTNSIEFIKDRKLFDFYVRIFRSQMFNTPNHDEHLNHTNLTNYDKFENILTDINDKAIQLSMKMAEQMAEINESNRINNTNLKTDDIVLSIYNEYKTYLNENYNIKLLNYIENVKVITMEYDYGRRTYAEIIKLNNDTNFNINV